MPDGTFRDPNCVGATWGCQPWGYPIPGYGTLIKADNGIETKLDSLLVSLDKQYTEDSKWGFTFAYTYSDASENRGNAYASDEHYLFDYPNLDGADFMRSSASSRHRLVMTGIIGTWGNWLFSTKLAVASPTPKEAVNCHDAASWNNCFFDPFTPGYDVGVKQLDIARAEGVGHPRRHHVPGSRRRAERDRLVQLHRLRHLARRSVPGLQRRTSATATAMAPWRRRVRSS